MTDRPTTHAPRTHRVLNNDHRSNTPMLLHEHNEHIAEAVFLEGIDVFATLIEDLAGAGPFETEAAGVTGSA